MFAVSIHGKIFPYIPNTGFLLASSWQEIKCLFISYNIKNLRGKNTKKSMEKVIKISIDAEEAYDKNQHPLKIKILKKIGIESF